MIQNKLKTLPSAPGVYIHLDAYLNIIYIGKAKDLSKRVTSYFKKNIIDIKTKALVHNISTFEFIVTKNEEEALLLENELIKKYMPKYNIMLRDDKSYPFIKLTEEQFPRLIKSREIKKGNGTYYGPFADSNAVDKVVDLLNNVYRLKQCKKTSWGKSHKRCLNFHINKCEGYCLESDLKTIKAYNKKIKEINEFLNGKTKQITLDIHNEIKEAVKVLDYERAIKLRDYVKSIQIINEKRRDIKYLLKHEMMKLREKKIEEKIVIEELIKFAKIKKKQTLRIESYDISNTSGDLSVGSLVVFYNFDRASREYRKFKIKTASNRDDYGAINEVLSRRFRNYIEDNKSFNILPDLILLDGGIGQVNTGKKVLSEYKLNIPILGMVKDTKHRTKALVYDDENIFLLKNNIKLHKFITKIQDETHRFAITFHKDLRKKKMLKK